MHFFCLADNINFSNTSNPFREKEIFRIPPSYFRQKDIFRIPPSPFSQRELHL